jgi:hypothetical protein
VGPLDLTKLARLRNAAQEKEGVRQVCMQKTLCSTMFVPDRMFPEYLSAAYVVLGPPRHSIFLPVPMGLTALPESFADSRWGTRGLKLLEKLSLEHPYLKEFEALEAKFFREFEEVREKVRLLLLKNQRAEAQKLLLENFCRQYKEAGALMSEIEKKAALLPKAPAAPAPAPVKKEDRKK